MKQRKLEHTITVSSGRPKDWPAITVKGNRRGHSGLNFSSVTIEDGSGERAIHISPAQARRLAKALPYVAAFARR